MGTCIVEGCDRKPRGSMCAGHQTQKQRGKPFTPIKERRKPDSDPYVKWCPKCETEKSRSDFHNNSSTYDGKASYCKPCISQYEKDRWHTKRKPVAQARYFRQTYNLTPTEVEQMLESQGGVCAICGQVPERRVVDHCHDSGKVRGILCDTCNRCLGLLKDDANVLMSAAAYLLQHEDVLSTVGGE